MRKVKSYALAYVQITKASSPLEQIGWPLILLNHKIQKKIINLLKQNSTATLNQLKMPKIMINLLRLLIADEALNQLDQILLVILRNNFSENRALALNLTLASADSDVEKIIQSIQGEIKIPLLVETKVESKILGGAVIQFPGKTIDLSLRKKLQILKHQLTRSTI